MSFGQTVALGALAGFTIYLGLPAGRLQLLSSRGRVALAMFSVGILAFIFVDVLSHANEIVEAALGGFKDGRRSFGDVAGLTLLLAVGFTVGGAGLGILERRLRPGANPPMAGGSSEAATLAATDVPGVAPRIDGPRRQALRTGMIIATAIGLHNFAEGLAIGVSARAGAVSLATVLIVGFALHNATEGFGIIGPLGGVTPSCAGWRSPASSAVARRSSARWSASRSPARHSSSPSTASPAGRSSTSSARSGTACAVTDTASSGCCSWRPASSRAC